MKYTLFFLTAILIYADGNTQPIIHVQGQGFDYLPKAQELIRTHEDLDHALHLLRLAQKANDNPGFCGTEQSGTYGKIHYLRSKVHTIRREFLQALAEIDTAGQYFRDDEAYNMLKIQILEEIYGGDMLRKQISEKADQIDLPDDIILGYVCLTLDSPPYKLYMSIDWQTKKIDWENTTLQEVLKDMPFLK